MDQEYFRKLLVQWASEDVYINQLTWEEGDALAEYLAKWYAAQQPLALDGATHCACGLGLLPDGTCPMHFQYTTHRK